MTLEDKWPNFVPQVALGQAIYDPAGEAQKLIEQIQILYNAGPRALQPAEWDMRKRYWHRAMGRLIDYKGDLVIFLLKFGDFYDRMNRYYFEKKNMWSMPWYKALPYIEEHDGDYAEIIKKLAFASTPEERITLCREAYKWIFEETI